MKLPQRFPNFHPIAPTRIVNLYPCQMHIAEYKKGCVIDLGSLMSQSNCRSELTTIDQTEMRPKQGEGKGHCVSTSDMAYPRIKDERRREFTPGADLLWKPKPDKMQWVETNRESGVYCVGV